MENEERIVIPDEAVELVDADISAADKTTADSAKSGIKLEGINIGVGNINDSKGKNAEISGFKGDINFGNVTEEKPVNKQRFADAANMQVPTAKQNDNVEFGR